MNSISYYEKNAKAFYDRTIHADIDEIYQKFLTHLPKQPRILDAGCGSGRDSNFFLNKGYEVVAFDGSLEMVKLASTLIGQEALHLLFEEMDFSAEFDAIWANASLLHVPYENLRETFEKFHKALFPSGILYASFKYGSSLRKEGDRYFFDMNEASIAPYLKGLFEPLEICKMADTRSSVAPSPDKSWLHVIARRF